MQVFDTRNSELHFACAYTPRRAFGFKLERHDERLKRDVANVTHCVVALRQWRCRATLILSRVHRTVGQFERDNARHVRLEHCDTGRGAR